MKLSRLVQIEQYILNNQTVSIDQLCDEFGISKNTVRRDINELDKNGSIKKVYGGVTAVKNSAVPFEERDIKNKSEKLAIAEAAAAEICDGDIIYIDSGTTVPNVVQFLENKNITILTNSLNAVLNALPFPDINVISLGGTLTRKTNSFNGINLSSFKDLNINKAFMASTGITIVNGLTNSFPLEYEVKKTIIEKSREVFLLVDHTKFGVCSLMTYCRLDAVDHIITDKKPPEEYNQFFEDKRISVKIADMPRERFSKA